MEKKITHENAEEIFTEIESGKKGTLLMEKTKYSPGFYITTAERTAVSIRASKNSPRIHSLAKASVVYVRKILKLDYRFRGKIEENRWISLADNHLLFSTKWAEPFQRKLRLCPDGHHLLSLNAEDDKYFCNICSKAQLKDSTMYGCKACQYNECLTCYDKKNDLMQAEKDEAIYESPDVDAKKLGEIIPARYLVHVLETQENNTGKYQGMWIYHSQGWSTTKNLKPFNLK